jgi:heat shock protein HslJ
MKFMTTLLSLTLLLAACMPIQPGTGPTSVPPTQPGAQKTPETNGANALAGTQWVLESYGAAGAETPVVGEDAVTIQFDNAGQVSGSGGCNSYSGSYLVDGNTLTLTEIVSTLMACVDTALMDQEIEYFDALQTVSEFQIEGDRLTLTYDDGQGALHFVRATSTPNEEQVPPTETPAPEAEAPRASQSFVWNYNRYSSPLPFLGGGPSTITVHDLWLIDVASEQSEPIFSEQNVAFTFSISPQSVPLPVSEL